VKLVIHNQGIGLIENYTIQSEKELDSPLYLRYNGLTKSPKGEDPLMKIIFAGAALGLSLLPPGTD